MARGERKIPLRNGQGQTLRHVGGREAWEMEMAGRAMVYCDGAGRRYMQLVERHHPGVGVDRSDPVTITRGDLWAAAGAWLGSGRESTGHQRYEAARIRIWPEIHDTRAVCVAGAWA